MICKIIFPKINIPVTKSTIRFFLCFLYEFAAKLFLGKSLKNSNWKGEGGGCGCGGGGDKEFNAHSLFQEGGVLQIGRLWAERVVIKKFALFCGRHKWVTP